MLLLSHDGLGCGWNNEMASGSQSPPTAEAKR